MPTTPLRIRTPANQSRKATHTLTPEKKEPEDRRYEIPNASSHSNPTSKLEGKDALTLEGKRP